MVGLINKQLLLTAYAYLFIMEQQGAQQGSEALQLRVEQLSAYVPVQPAAAAVTGSKKESKNWECPDCKRTKNNIIDDCYRDFWGLECSNCKHRFWDCPVCSLRNSIRNNCLACDHERDDAEREAKQKGIDDWQKASLNIAADSYGKSPFIMSQQPTNQANPFGLGKTKN